MTRRWKRKKKVSKNETPTQWQTAKAKLDQHTGDRPPRYIFHKLFYWGWGVWTSTVPLHQLPLQLPRQVFSGLKWEDTSPQRISPAQAHCIRTLVAPLIHWPTAFFFSWGGATPRAVFSTRGGSPSAPEAAQKRQGVRPLKLSGCPELDLWHGYRQDSPRQFLAIWHPRHSARRLKRRAAEQNKPENQKTHELPRTLKSGGGVEGRGRRQFLT